MIGFLRWLKKQADFVQSLGILCGAAAGVILVFGGSIPPWETKAEAQTASGDTAKINAATVAALQKFNEKLDGVTHRLDLGDCNSFQRQLESTQIALNKNPSDTSAKMLRDLVESQMRNIPGCRPF